MRRRDFLAVVSGAAVAWPLAVRAQQAKVPVVGFLHGASPDTFAASVAAFRRGMSETGFDEGRNVSIDFRWLEGRYERSAEVVAELIRRPVDLIFAAGSPAPLRAAKAATSTIPIVFTIARDPVQLGLVESLNRPGGNMTGVYMFIATLEGKRLGLLREVVPNAPLIAVLLNPTFENEGGQLKAIQEAAATLGQAIKIVHATNERGIDAAFATAVQAGAQAMLIGGDAFFTGRSAQIIALAARHAMPTMHEWREHAVAGGLMGYGTNVADGYHQAGVYVGRVLKGEKPANLPVVQTTKFELVLNLKTARTLGIEIPPGLSARADEVIE